MVIVTKKVKELVRSEGLRVGDGFLDALEVKTASLLQEAVARAKLNNRSTVFKRDL